MTDQVKDNFEEEIFGQLFSEGVSATLDKYEIKKLPKEMTLSSFLAGYTKEKLFALADDNGIEITKSWKKAYLVEHIHDEIMETIEERLLILGEDHLKLLRKFKFHILRPKNLSDKEIEFYLTVYSKAVRMGLLFSMDEKDQMVTWMPDDIGKLIHDVLDNFAEIKKKHQSQIRVWEQIDEALIASIHLYGAASLSRVMELLEILYPEPNLTNEQIIEFSGFVSKIIPFLVIKNNYYFIDKYVVGSHQLADEEEVVGLYNYVTSKMDRDYYEPTKEDVQYFAKHSFDRRTPVYKKLKQLISKYTKHVDQVMDLIEYNIKMDFNLSDLMKEVADFELLQFNNEEQIGEFADLYTQLNNNTRLWENAGYTPSELFAQETNNLDMYNDFNILDLVEEEQSQNNVIPLASYQKIGNKKQEPIRVNKIGRNEPCPCGSGKKYKKCCMRKNK